MRRVAPVVLISLAVGASSSAATGWSVGTSGSLLEVGYGTKGNYPQVLVMDLTSSYYRLNTGPGCGWGTSVVLWPCYWSQNVLYQGGIVDTVNWSVSGTQLVITVTGRVGTLTCAATMKVSPPVGHSLSVSVSENISGNASIDPRKNEAFKPVMLSSMNDGPLNWDSYNLLTNSGLNWYPSSG